jgi:tetratricopeptide (TPR) repeat protein
MLRSFLSSLLFCLSLTTLSGSEAQHLLQQANAAFQKKEYQKALEGYEKVQARGYQSAALEYNLGMAWYRLENRGKAMLHLERAALIAPQDGDILHNLELLRREVNPDMEALPDFFLARIWQQAQNLAGPTSMAALGLLLWWGGMAALMLWLKGRSRQQKKAGFALGIALTLASLLPFALAGSRAARQLDSHSAVVLEQTSLRSGPEQDGTEIAALPEGTRVQLKAFLEGWWQVKLTNGETGWLETKTLEKI